MSLRSNKLEFLPDEIGQMQKLRVLNLSDNRLKNLPFTFTKLKELAALWLSDNQSKALIPLQTEAHPETKQRVLTNYMFPQQPRSDEDFQSDSDSFNPTLWEEQRQQRMTVAFEFEDKKEEEENPGKVKVEINLKRYPTPYPEDLKNMVKSVQNLVSKPSLGVRPENSAPAATTDPTGKDKYEHKWPLTPKEISVEVQAKETKEPPESPQADPEHSPKSPLEAPGGEDRAQSSEVQTWAAQVENFTLCSALHPALGSHRFVPLHWEGLWEPLGTRGAPGNLCTGREGWAGSLHAGITTELPEELALRALDAFGHPGSEMRIGELRPSMPETPLYPPKLVLLGKDKKGTDGFTAFEMKPCGGDVPPLLSRQMSLKQIRSIV
ncbi:hypothetical protein DV515_00014690 [Chloebia gouldiae]|uniref:Leucine-rich repeat-containing protein 7 n=1 Tax=Chloebia gouldiae TaxID=44316 RepID=A0A3L8RXP2_CHLGU|nr:hypothetical protein DV515_00014690 [Chloebia gouldiae]